MFIRKFFNNAIFSASLIFCITTCLAVPAATLPKSFGVTSSSIVSPIFIVGTILIASSSNIWASLFISGSILVTLPSSSSTTLPSSISGTTT